MNTLPELIIPEHFRMGCGADVRLKVGDVVYVRIPGGAPPLVARNLHSVHNNGFVRVSGDARDLCCASLFCSPSAELDARIESLERDLASARADRDALRAASESPTIPSTS